MGIGLPCRLLLFAAIVGPAFAFDAVQLLKADPRRGRVPDRREYDLLRSVDRIGQLWQLLFRNAN
jgi:hypothetical protein